MVIISVEQCENMKYVVQLFLLARNPQTPNSKKHDYQHIEELNESFNQDTHKQLLTTNFTNEVKQKIVKELFIKKERLLILLCNE